MIIIDDDYFIEVDSGGYTAKKYKRDETGNIITNKKGDQLTVVVGYYNLLKSAILGIREHKIKSELTDGFIYLDVALAIIQRITDEFNTIINKAVGE